MWLTIAYDREKNRVWLCTFARTEQQALDEMTSDRRELDHIAIDVMNGSFAGQLIDWGMDMGLTPQRANALLHLVREGVNKAADIVAKTAHKRN